MQALGLWYEFVQRRERLKADGMEPRQAWQIVTKEMLDEYYGFEDETD